MANQPIQLPNIDLPGAEFFSLSPNRTVALQGRKRFVQSSGNVTIPAGGQQIVAVTAVIETGFVNGSGIYLHDFWMQYFPVDGTQELNIGSISCGLTLSTTAGDFAYALGSPLLTQLAPAGSITAITDRDKLITQRDLALIGQFTPLTTNLTLTVAAGIANKDPTNPHTLSIRPTMIWTRLDGVLE